jgi:uncharacterized protein with GYD domain
LTPASVAFGGLTDNPYPKPGHVQPHDQAHWGLVCPKVLWIAGSLNRQTAEAGEIRAENGRSVMPLFITQGRFTREYIKGGLAKPEDRQVAIARLCEQVGGKLVSLYFTMGQYDFIVISEMPDAKAASVLAFVAAGGGGIEGW